MHSRAAASLASCFALADADADADACVCVVLRFLLIWPGSASAWGLRSASMASSLFTSGLSSPSFGDSAAFNSSIACSGVARRDQTSVTFRFPCVVESTQQHDKSTSSMSLEPSSTLQATVTKHM